MGGKAGEARDAPPDDDAPFFFGDDGLTDTRQQQGREVNAAANAALDWTTRQVV